MSNETTRAFELADRAISHYVAEAMESLTRNDWREALMLLTQAKLIDDASYPISHAIKCLEAKVAE